jgi:hypothetical protein
VQSDINDSDFNKNELDNELNKAFNLISDYIKEQKQFNKQISDSFAKFI